MPKRVEKYSLGGTLGRGTFSKVKYAIDTTSPSKSAYAIKIIDRKMVHEENMEEQLKREIAIMKILKHPNIIQMREVLQSSKHIYIVLELITGGELLDKIVKAKRFPERVARRYFQSLIGALEYTHSQGIAHRDLKPENLLLDENDNLKITDFGLSALSSSSDGRSKVLMTTCGTPNYVAPEVLKERGYNGFQADIWSCGVILYVMLAGHPPFQDDTLHGLFNKIEMGSFSFPPHFSPEVKKFINRMLIVNPNKRATIKDVIEDPWFKIGFQRQDTKKLDLSNLQLDRSIRDANVTTEETIDSPKSNSTTPNTLNAFDIFGDMMQGVVTPLISGKVKIRRETRFAAEGDAETVSSKLFTELKKLKVNPQKKNGNDNIACVLQHQSNLLIFVVEIVATSGGFCLVELQKRKGDTLIFNQFYRSLVSILGDFVLSNENSS